MIKKILPIILLFYISVAVPLSFAKSEIRPTKYVNIEGWL